MRSALSILLYAMIQMSCLCFAQTEDVRLIDYLVNPTQQEREMFKDLPLSQLNEAIQIYDSNSLVDKLRGLTREIDGLNQDLEDVKQKKSASLPMIDSIRTMIINQIQLLRLTGEQKNITRVLKMVKDLIDDNPADATFMKPYLDVMFQIGDWNECERVLSLFEANCQNEFDLARIYQNKAYVASAKNQIPEALTMYHDALDIYEKYVTRYGYNYQGIATKILSAYNMLIQQYYRLEEQDSCRLYMDKLLKIGDIAVKYDSIDAPVGYASACNSMANKLYSFGETEKADSIYNVAYKYLEAAYQVAPFRNGPTYAFYYMYKARDFLAKEDLESAVKNSDTALDVMTRIYRVFPKWSAVNYFESLRLRGQIYTAMNQFAEAEKILLTAKDELDEIELDSPGTNQLRYYFLYLDFAYNHAAAERYEEAIASFEKAKTMLDGIDARVRDRSIAACDEQIQKCREAMSGNNSSSDKE